MTYQAHSRRLSLRLRAQDADDRRHYQRFEQHGLMARVQDKLLEIHDVSIGGIRVQRVDMAVGAPLSLSLFPRDGRRLDLAQSMTIRGEVVGHTGEWTRIRFHAMTFTLAKFLIQHLARRSGIEPFIFR
jgi:hypothetical protein